MHLIPKEKFFTHILVKHPNRRGLHSEVQYDETDVEHDLCASVI